jgi:hypothetical protein
MTKNVAPKTSPTACPWPVLSICMMKKVGLQPLQSLYRIFI